ncbi:glutactin-like isoform X2 [Tupaia chinensis]|uniref:glutactin-like isoform X2 n=1 Tax=Tupaia chinensis TaxID=246437 RepID=UPI000FFB501C|nr:glutactin-like isoform X2 [Tupaia chinensis]
MQEGREGPPPRLGLGEACLGVPCPEGRAKGHVFPLPHPMTVSLSHRATLSVRDPEASGLRPEQKDPEWDASFSTPRSRPLLRHPTTELRIPVAGALGDTQTEPSLDQVLQERDEAIAKKRAVEAELHTCKAKLRAVEAQLLEVLEEKLRLRQEVEAWEEDMQQLVRQQVQSQLERESRAALGAHMDRNAERPPQARTPWGRWVHWW